MPLATRSRKRHFGQDLFRSVVERDLSMELRQNLGATYGVNVLREAMRGRITYLKVSTAVDHAHLRAALSVIRRYWDSGEQLTRLSSIDAARWNAARGSLTKLSTTHAVAHEIFGYWNIAWPIDDIEKYEERLAAVPAAALGSVLSIVGDEPTIRAAWE